MSHCCLKSQATLLGTSVELVVNGNSESANHTAATECIYVWRKKARHQNGEDGDIERRYKRLWMWHNNSWFQNLVGSEFESIASSRLTSTGDGTRDLCLHYINKKTTYLCVIADQWPQCNHPMTASSSMVWRSHLSKSSSYLKLVFEHENEFTNGAHLGLKESQRWDTADESAAMCDTIKETLTKTSGTFLTPCWTFAVTISGTSEGKKVEVSLMKWLVCTTYWWKVILDIGS